MLTAHACNIAPEKHLNHIGGIVSDDEYNYGTSTTSWDARLGLEPFIDLVFWVVFAAVIIGVAVALSRLVARTIVLRKRGLSVTDQIELALKTAWWSMVHPSK